MNALLSPLISSKTRARLLLRFFSNPGNSTYLRALSSEFDLSSNTVREELNRLTHAQLLRTFKSGREIHYQANDQHPLFGELISIVKKVLGIDQVIDNIIARLGDLRLAILVDDYAEGRDTGIIDLVLVGEIDQQQLSELVAKTEAFIDRKIRTLSLNSDEYKRLAPVILAKPSLVLWQQES